MRKPDSNPRPFALLELEFLCPSSLQSAEGRTFESHSGRWHPDVDVDRDIVPTLLPHEKEALQAARSGNHMSLTERLYTTGKAVRRDA